MASEESTAEVATSGEKEEPCKDTNPPPAPSNVRYDWYQTECDVVVAIMIKNVRSEDVRMEYTPTSVSVCSSKPTNFSLHLQLTHTIVPERCIMKTTPSKIEVKLRKDEGVRWAALERAKTGDDTVVKQFTPTAAEATADPADVHKYPSSAHVGQKDWNKLAADISKEETEDKDEGEAALNKLFQKIYADGTDEVKKAMMKSFTESGGTVLSTNWGDVGKEKVDVKPPDGMEWRTWEK